MMKNVDAELFWGIEQRKSKTQRSISHLKCWTFKTRLPKDDVSASVVADGAVVVGERDPAAPACHRHLGERVAF